MWENPERVESAIKRLTREIEEIDDFFYMYNEKGNRLLHVNMLERKRNDIVRSVVLQMHTSIESLLNDYIAFRISGASGRRGPGRGQSALALRKMLYGGGSIGFEMKLNLALALRIISAKTRERLALLNACVTDAATIGF